MSYRNERELLNHLIELCRDEEQTLRYAADRVTEKSTKALLTELAAARARFAEDLVPHAQRLGGADAGSGTALGALNRRWAELKDRVVGHTDQAMIAEAEQAEDRVQATYVSALDDMLPPTVRDLVERQLGEIRAAHDQVRLMLAH